MPEIGNVTSDKLSKNVALETKLMLETSIIRKICGKVFNPDIDSIASSQNYQSTQLFFMESRFRSSIFEWVSYTVE